MNFNHPEFPNSNIEPFFLTSPKTPFYNCIAWAFGDDTKWFWPDAKNQYYWPSEIPREETLEAFISLFALIGYQICTDDSVENDFEKIAIFSKNDKVSHAARQLPDGFWTSKLGVMQDISHSIFSMNDGFYGSAVVFMRRSY